MFHQSSAILLCLAPLRREFARPGITLTRDFCEFCTTSSLIVPGTYLCEVCTRFIPVPRTSVNYVDTRPCRNTRGTGTTLLYLRGTYVRSVRQCLNTQTICGSCMTLAHARSQNFTEFCSPPCHHTGDFFCGVSLTAVPVPGTRRFTIEAYLNFSETPNLNLRASIPHLKTDFSKNQSEAR